MKKNKNTVRSTKTFTSPQASAEQIWEPLDKHGMNADMLPFLDNEQLLAEHLNDYSVSGVVWQFWTHKGERFRTFDLETFDGAKFEVKTLSKNGNGFDRRFKMGTRGKSMFGKLESKFRAAALGIEDWLDHDHQSGLFGQTLDDTRALLKCIHEGRLGKSNCALMLELCRDLHDVVPECSRLLDQDLKNLQVSESYQDIDGIFLIADVGQRGDKTLVYTLLDKNGINTLVTFDSMNVEGVMARYSGNLPTRDKTEKKQNESRKHQEEAR